MQHLLKDSDLNKAQIEALIALGKAVKADPKKYGQALAGKSVVTLFEKPSLRTRVTFDIGIAKLGGHSVYLDQQNGALGKRESVKDFAANLSRWCDAIVARVFDHQTLVELAEHGTVPVVNSLCNLYHPCQGLADFMTISEHYGDLSKVKLAYLERWQQRQPLPAAAGGDPGYRRDPGLPERPRPGYPDLPAGPGAGGPVRCDHPHQRRRDGHRGV